VDPFAKDSGPPFELFGPAHLVTLGVLALAGLSFLLLRRSPSRALRRGLRYGLAALLAINELGWHYWVWRTGQWSIQAMLPLHLCTLSIILSVFMLLFRSYRLFEFIYFLGLGGAIQTVMTPDLGIHDGFPHYRFFQIFISHGGVILAVVCLLTMEGFRPTWKSLQRVVVWTNVYVILIMFLNKWLGSNYLYIAHPPPTESLIDFLGPWPWYILSMEAVGLATCFILYLPFIIRDRHPGRAPRNPGAAGDRPAANRPGPKAGPPHS